MEGTSRLGIDFHITRDQIFKSASLPQIYFRLGQKKFQKTIQLPEYPKAQSCFMKDRPPKSPKFLNSPKILSRHLISLKIC